MATASKRRARTYDENGEEVDPRGSVRPVPDPTVLTTQQLERYIDALREILEAQIGGQKAVFESRLDGMDKAIQLLQVMTDRQPTLVDGKILNLQRLHEEKFESIATQFSERDTRSETQQRDQKVAVDAALQAQKESVGAQNASNSLAINKSEGTFTKQIDQLGVLINTTAKAADDKIDDLKERVQRIEGTGVGVKTSQDEGRANTAIYISAASVIVVIVFGVMQYMGRNGGPTIAATAPPSVIYIQPSPTGASTTQTESTTTPKR